MRVINLFGGPGAGKSTTSAGLFFLMKSNHEKIHSVEIVTEFAKDLVYSKRFHELDGQNQLYVLAKQASRIHRLKEQVDYVVTDSPILLSLIYMAKNYYPSFNSLVLEIFNSYDNINIYLNRTKSYKPYGRMQTEEESNEIGNNILNILTSNNIEFHTIDGDINAPVKIFDIIKNDYLL